MLLPLAAAIVPRAIVIFLRFMQPLLIRQVAAWVSRPLTEFTTNEGWGLTAAAGLIYAGLAVSKAAVTARSLKFADLFSNLLSPGISNDHDDSRGFRSCHLLEDIGAVH